MLLLAKLILGFFDKFTLDKVFKFIKTVIDNKINILLDVGSHKGEYIVNITKSFSINKLVVLPVPMPRTDSSFRLFSISSSAFFAADSFFSFWSIILYFYSF